MKQLKTSQKSNRETLNTMTYLKKNEPAIKSSAAYDMIRELIMTGEFLPGARLITNDLEAKLGVGRGVIREALMRLDKSGLVHNIPYKGAVVAKLPSYREMANIYEARILIECQLARESMRHITKSDIIKLDKITKEMQNFSKKNSFIFSHDRAFHITLYKIANMPHLLGVLERWLDLVDIFLNAKFFPPEEFNVFVGQHVQMLAAIKNRDTETLCKILAENISYGLELIHHEFVRFSRFKHMETDI